MRKRIVFAVALLMAAIIPLIRPGDAPFIHDEPNLLLLAHKANQDRTLAEVGFSGNVGLPYGPLPIWIYQLILSATTVPSRWVLLRSLLVMSAIAAGLLLLSRGAGLWKWAVPAVLCSPYLWFYSRHLWDNSFLLPLSCLAIGAYAYGLSSRSSAAFLVSLAASLLLPFIHLMAVPLSAAVFLHMALFARKQRRGVRIAAGAVVAAIGLLQARYLSHVISGIGALHPQAAMSVTDRVKAWIYPFFGGRLQSGWGLEYFYGTDWLPAHPAFLVAKGITGLAYVFVLLGICLACADLWKSRARLYSSRRSGEVPGRVAVKTHLSLIALMALLLDVAGSGLLHSSVDPHYYNGLWVVYVFLAWLTIDKIAEEKGGRLLYGAYGLSCAAICVVIAFLVCERGGTRGIYYGPTIRNQLEIARDIGSADRDDVSYSVRQLADFPALKALRAICLHGEPARKKGPLVIEFALSDARYGFVRARSGPGTAQR